MTTFGGFIFFSLNHREECAREFWDELETRKAAGTLSKDSPFWAMGELAVTATREVPAVIPT